MLLSMTGFGESRKRENGINVHVEIKTVNNRYFKLSLRANEGYGLLESQIESVLRQSVKRGSVQLNLQVTQDFSPDRILFNESALTSYWTKLQQWSKSNGVEMITSPVSLLALPGVTDDSAGSRESSVEDTWPVIESALIDAADKLAQMRAREGAAMGLDLSANIKFIRNCLDQIRVLAPAIPQNYAAKLTERINTVLQEHDIQLDAKDIIREVAIFTDKCDISEEIVRLASHLDQFDNLIVSPETEGRKLDFLTQEMNRETNTIGSKANDVQIARLVIEIKAVIEKIREMVQNIE